MQEALISLMQMAKTSAILERMKRAAVPYVSVMTDPVYGGVSASLAMLGDINIAEPNARAGFAGPNIIEQTIRQKLPKGFQRSEFLLERGAIDMIVPRLEMRQTIARVLGKLLSWPQPGAEQNNNTVVVGKDADMGDMGDMGVDAPFEGELANAPADSDAQDNEAEVVRGEDAEVIFDIVKIVQKTI